MSSIDPSVFSHEMLSLKTLKDWSLFTILKKVKEAGYTGPPSEPIAAYRRALLSTMSHNQPNENERIGDIYLKAEKAYISLDSELMILDLSDGQDEIISATASVVSSDPEKNGETMDSAYNEGPLSRVLWDGLCDTEQSETGSTGLGNEITSSSSSTAFAASDEDEFVPVPSKSSRQSNAKQKAGKLNGKTPPSVAKAAKQNDKSKVAKSAGKSSALISSILKSVRQNDKLRTTKPSEKTPALVSTASKRNSRSKVTNYSEEPPILVSTARKNDKSKASKSSERATPASTVSKQNGKSKATDSRENTSAPASASSNASRQKTTGPMVSKPYKVTPPIAVSPSRFPGAERPLTPEKRTIMKHPVPWTSPGHAYIQPVIKPSGRSDLIKGFISREPGGAIVNRLKRKRATVGEPIVRPVKLAKSVEAPEPHRIMLSDGPERAIKNGRRVKIPEPKPAPLPMAKPRKPVRYKYKFAPRPKYKYRDDIPCNGPRT